MATTEDSMINFMLMFTKEYVFTSTANLTALEVANARSEGRLFVDEKTSLGFVALPLGYFNG